MRTVVITGIAGRLASLVAGALSTQLSTTVIGVGQELPSEPVAGVRLVQCDMSMAALLDVLTSAHADVVVHLDIPQEELAKHNSNGRGNLFRAVELLGACERAGIGHLVLRSSTLIYGARPESPAYIPEQTPALYGSRASLARDYAEIERVASQFAARCPALRVTAVRCAGIVGGGAPSPLGRYLTQRPAPTLLGFDPRIQLLHADDAAAAFALATCSETLVTAINLAVPEPLPLSKAIALAGGQALPLLQTLYTTAARSGDGLPSGVGRLFSMLAAPASHLLSSLPFDSDYLRYACVADTRHAHEALGWRPQHTAEDSLRELAARPTR